MSYMNILCNKEKIMHFLWKLTFAPCDLKWPKSKFQPTTFVEEVKLMHMHKSRVYATVGVDAFLTKMTFWLL